jgi:hypothetical protein
MKYTLYTLHSTGYKIYQRKVSEADDLNLLIYVRDKIKETYGDGVFFILVEGNIESVILTETKAAAPGEVEEIQS